MQSINGATATGSPVHSDAIDITKTPQANGGVKAQVTSHMTGNSSKGVEGGINNPGGGSHGPRFTNNH